MAEVLAGKRSKLSDQVAQTIRQRIRTGDYHPGDTLPPVRKMCREFGVSINVIQRALLALENDNVVISHPGRSIEICKADACHETAIVFGLIIPYSSSMFFASQIALHAEQVFSQRHNFLVMRTSDDDPAKERQVAEHLINNGVQGLLVWPTSNDPNTEFFAHLSEQIPVVFVDRRMPMSHLPCVVEDYYSCGMDMIAYLANEQKCKKIYALIDDLNVTSYQDFQAGIKTAAAKQHHTQIVFESHPITQDIARWNQSNFSQLETISEKLVDSVLRIKADALICAHADFLDYVFFQSNAAALLQGRNLQITTIAHPQTNTRSLLYNRHKIQEWMSGHAPMIQCAADMLQERILSKKKLVDRFEQITLERRKNT